MASRIWSIEWCRFQRPSVSHNLDFKVTAASSIRYAWLVFMQLTRDLFAIAKFLLTIGTAFPRVPPRNDPWFMKNECYTHIVELVLHEYFRNERERPRKIWLKRTPFVMTCICMCLSLSDAERLVNNRNKLTWRSVLHNMQCLKWLISCRSQDIQEEQQEGWLYRQLNVRQLGSLRPWDHRGKCYINRSKENSMLVKRLAACTHLSSTFSS